MHCQGISFIELPLCVHLINILQTAFEFVFLIKKIG
jgi:hypothetical protein